MIEGLAVAGIIALASFVRSAIGFGMGLIAMPLLGLVMEVSVATPMLASLEWPYRSLSWVRTGRK